MATEIYDGISHNAIIGGGKELWYKIKFNNNGKANFHASPENKNVNIELYIYNGESKTSKLIAFSKEGIGKDETIFSIPVAFGKWYYINVRNCSQDSTKFFVRAKNYTNENGTENLQIQNITAKNSLIAGKSARFSVEVKNKGNCTSVPYSVKGYCDGDFFNERRESPLNAGDTDLLNFRHAVDKAGEYEMKFIVDGMHKHTLSKKFTWDKTQAAKMATRMPLTNLFNVRIPDDLGTDDSVSKSIRISAYQTATFQAGVSDTSPKYNAYLNFNNGRFVGINFGNGSIDLAKEKIEGFGILSQRLASYFNRYGFSSVTISAGGIKYDDLTKTISFTKFQIQNAVDIDGGETVYTSLTISEDINLNRLATEVVLALAGLAIIFGAAEIVAGGVLSGLEALAGAAAIVLEKGL